MLRQPFLLVSFVLGLGAIGCNTMATTGDGGTGGDMAQPPGADMAVQPFQADAPAVYVAKVKDLLVGLPPTDDEVKAVVADPNALGGLIKTWMGMPEYQTKMTTFFQLAFQQTQITASDFVDMIPNNGLGKGSMVTQLVQNIQESFARTVYAQVSAGVPINQMMTSKQVMMTPPMMELYAFLDTHTADDTAKITDTFYTQNGMVDVHIGTTEGMIPLADSLDPKNKNYMHFYDAGVANMKWPDPSCALDPLVYPAVTGNKASQASYTLHDWLLGTLSQNKFTSPTGFICKQTNGRSMNSPFTNADFNDWKMVTIRQPNQGEPTTPFWDTNNLKMINTLVLNTPRQGFFSTPAFFANWSTNTSNQMRVTINQTLIVATGQAIDGTDATTPANTPGLDAEHAAPGTPCFGCHQLLDPTRSILAKTYSWAYSPQSEQKYLDEPGQFAFEGVIQQVNTIDDFAMILSTHPLVAQAWAQKLCYYANSANCVTTDPEFQRIVKDFANGYQWNTLVQEMMASPLVTNTTQTVTAMQNGEVISVARRDELCSALNARLNLTDVCGLDVVNNQKQTVIQEIVGGLPSDGYGRGSPIPVLPNQPTLFYRAGVENICEQIAPQVIDANGSKWVSTNPDAAIADFVATIMGITPSDPRSAQAVSLLKDHYTQAMGGMYAQKATDALKSTFVVACLSPSFVGIGM